VSDGVVTVCIPAYQAESFIDRTLRCARGQTYEAQRILVAIDRSDDATEEICRSHAREDDRVEVHPHPDRVGWLGNVNHLLDRVRSEFAFVYFHDDLIEPTYSERLVEALRGRPDAASAHCDVVLDTADGERPRRGRTHDGSAAVRLLTYLVDPDRGALLRSMVRRASPAGRLRMTDAAAVYEMELVAAGPALRVPEPLYRRWNQRTGGLTDSWRRLRFDDLVEGCRVNAAMARKLIDDVEPTAVERDLLEFGLAVYITNRLRSLEANYDAPGLVDLAEVLGETAGLRLPAAVAQLPENLAALCSRALERAERRTAARARQVAGPGTPG
jgi:hypothetical protein